VGQLFGWEAEIPALVLATGTGFAPIKSIIEDALRRGNRRPLRLYWGGRDRDDLYMLDRVTRWTEKAPWISFVPVLSRPAQAWSGRTGFVHRAALAEFSDMRNGEGDACGKPLMSSGVRRALVRQAC